uniref:Uncharacterized protein n=1 Tax=Parascaris equorum TaxID=6256 RepID=A0A914RVA2_PAREQ
MTAPSSITSTRSLYRSSIHSEDIFSSSTKKAGELCTGLK